MILFNIGLRIVDVFDRFRPRFWKCFVDSEWVKCEMHRKWGTKNVFLRFSSRQCAKRAISDERVAGSVSWQVRAAARHGEFASWRGVSRDAEAAFIRQGCAEGGKFYASGREIFRLWDQRDAGNLGRRGLTFFGTYTCARRRSSSSTTRCISPSGAGLPVQISNWRAPCCTNISSPLTTARPRALASLSSGVSSGV